MAWNEALIKALPILETLEFHGYEAVFVGGCVRDTLLGLQLKDVDIATSATPQQVMELFPRTIATGLKHGTVTVVRDDEMYEVTTYRTESEYEQFRRPAQVEFVTSLEADLLRRDFTINAIAMRRDGTFADPYGGMSDMETRVLRCVGDSDARFREDALRMVRAVRFAAEFGMVIAADTWQALQTHRSLLSHVAMERVGAELDKMIGGSSPLRALQWFGASGLFGYTKHSLPDKLHAFASAVRFELNEGAAAEPGVSVIDCPACVLGNIGSLSLLDDRWAAVCIAFDLTPEETAELFASLCYSNARRSLASAVVRVHRLMKPEAAAAAAQQKVERMHRQWVGIMLGEGKQAAQTWLHIMNVIPALTGMNEGVETTQSVGGQLDRELLDKLQRSLEELPVWSLRELAVDGTGVLRALGRPGGPWLGALLNELLFAVASGQISNDRDRLLAYAAATMEASGGANKSDKESR